MVSVNLLVLAMLRFVAAVVKLYFNLSLTLSTLAFGVKWAWYDPLGSCEK